MLLLLVFLNYLFIYFYLWLCWVFVSVLGLSPVAASGGHSSLRCLGLSLSRPLLLRSTDSRRAGSVIVAHGPSCSAACGIFPDQGSNPCPLHWQADSQPLYHQGSPCLVFFFLCLFLFTQNFLHRKPSYVNKDSLFLSVHSVYILFLFFFLISGARISSAVLNNSGGSRHSSLFSVFRRRKWTINIMLAIDKTT